MKTILLCGLMLYAAPMAAAEFPLHSPTTHVKTIAREVGKVLKLIFCRPAVVGKDDGSARPDNCDIPQPVWDEPSGRIPSRTERGRTCQSGDVSRFMPSFTDVIWNCIIR